MTYQGVLHHPYEVPEMKKTYVLERIQRQEVEAYSEEEARVRLTELGYIEEEFELIDVWSAE
jgi:hypothetical protein